MRNIYFIIIMCCLSMILGNSTLMAGETLRIGLPAPLLEGVISVEQALGHRRSVREYGSGGLKLEEVSQILWAAQGITHSRRFRTAPSAGALYPLELYLVVGEVDGIKPGVYQYRPVGHELVLVQEGDLRQQLCASALYQGCIARAPVILVITGDYKRTARKYGTRAKRYVHIEVGHAAQNVYLQCTSWGMGTVFVGAFDDTEVVESVGLPKDHAPLGLMPIGRKQ